MSVLTMCDEAVRYADAGVYVFPILSKNQPLTKHGCLDASIDVRQVRSWWRARPHAGIAIATGPSGFVVVDVDLKSGLSTVDEARRVLDLPETFTVSTPNAGFHFYFHASPGCSLGNSAGRLMFGVDTRATGGYVVAPPTPGYDVVSDVDAVALPDHVLTLLSRKSPILEPISAPFDVSASSPYGCAALDAEIRAVQGSPEGVRNDTLNRAAFAIGQLVEAGHCSESDAVAALCSAAASAGLDPAEFSEDNVLRMIGDGRSSPRASVPSPKPNRATERVPVPPARSGGMWRPMSEIAPERTEWLWYPRIPVGKLTLLAGMQGLGKSYLALQLAADVSAGRTLPDTDTCISGAVLLACYEDGAADTLRPRLDLLGARLDRVLLLEPEDDTGRTRPFSPDDIPVLEEQLQFRRDVKLMIVDPITSFQGGRIDGNKNNEVRASLQPLAELAQRYGIAVIAVAHLNKAEQSEAMYRVSGSVAYTALPRSVLIVGKEADTGRKAMAHVKNNLGPCAEPVEFEITNAGFRWLGVESELSAERMLTSRSDSSPDSGAADERAVAFLTDHLRFGARCTSDIREAATAASLPWRAVERAAQQMNVTKQRPDGRIERGAEWSWRL